MMPTRSIVRTEPVEVPLFHLAEKGRGFDKLCPNGVLA